MSYTSIKLGAYAPVRDALGAGKDSPFYMKFVAGAITGGVGSVAGNVSGRSLRLKTELTCKLVSPAILNQLPRKAI